MLVLERTLQHEDLLSAGMSMATQAIEQLPLHPRQRRGGLVQRGDVEHGALVEVGLELHEADPARR